MRLLAVLLVVPLCSGCQALVNTADAALEVELAPVVLRALWEERPAVVHLPGPAPLELQRAARTAQGVWHFETRYDDGSLRHHVWDPQGLSGLRGCLLPSTGPWPDAPLVQLGEWRPPAPYPAEGARAVEVSRPASDRTPAVVLKTLLTPPAAALDLGYLGALGAAKLLAGVVVLPRTIFMLTFELEGIP